VFQKIPESVSATSPKIADNIRDFFSFFYLFEEAFQSLLNQILGVLPSNPPADKRLDRLRADLFCKERDHV
jgi:hypothetical protein